MVIVTALVLANLGKAFLFIAIGQPPLIGGDVIEYWSQAEQMRSGDWFLCQDPVAHRTPGYPLFLALLQASFGKNAQIAGNVIQQLELIAVAVLAAWICWQLTRWRLAVVICLVLSLLSFSRHYFAMWLYSDTALCFCFTIYLAVLVKWYQRPSLALTVALGAAMGVSALIKPVALLLWVPTLPAMVFRRWEAGGPRRIVGQVACLLVTMGVLLSPWVLRNKYCFGEFFVTKFAGRQLWAACLCRKPSESPLLAGLDFADGPHTRSLCSKLGVDKVPSRGHWTIYYKLRAAGCGEIEAENLMFAATLEAIRGEPWKYLRTRMAYFGYNYVAAHFVMVWPYGVPNPARPDQTYWIKPEDATIKGQVSWSSPSLAKLHAFIVRYLWHPSRFLYFGTTLAVLAACIWMVRRMPWRPLAWTFVLLLLYFPACNAFMAEIDYRYRIMLEPLMIVVVSVALAGLLRRAPTKALDRS